MHQEFSTIQRLLTYALQENASVSLPKGIFIGGAVSIELVQRISDSAGLDVAGYHFLIEHSAIRHILNRHGKADKEQLHGQEAITEADMLRLPEMLHIPTLIAPGLPRRKDIRLIEFVVNDLSWEVTIILEVRTGRRLLCPVTMYKRKGQPQ